ncbi:MAG: DUF3576 domain-containing protein [Rhodospirillales bacterium]|nr:DUF3576 domain-containing protein [Rhodospirillales bacterium]
MFISSIPALRGKSVLYWRFAARAAVLAVAIAATGCSGSTEYNYPDKKPGQKVDPTGSTKSDTTLLGTDGLRLFGKSPDQDQAGSGGLGVNSFLWRASLDSISFMPLASADPFGGVIITDWYTPPETPSERFKLNVYILGRQLRADGIKAAVFRQRRDAGGNWVDSAVEAKTAIDLENAILTRARQLRIDTARP